MAFKDFEYIFSLNRKVHVTRQTLELLDGEYFYELGTESAKKDPLLVNNDIETFLISPHYYGELQVKGICNRFFRPRNKLHILLIVLALHSR